MGLYEWFTTYWFNPNVQGGVGLSYSSIILLVWIQYSLFKRAMKRAPSE